MEEFKYWVEIAKEIGAGATVVLGPAVYFLWKAWSADRDYIRESDKNTLKILSELTTVMQTDGKDGERRHTELEKAIQNSTESIKAHINAHIRPQ